MYSKVSKSTIQRLPAYLRYLQTLNADENSNISSAAIASALSLNEVQVRKDLASVATAGRPRVGYNACDLMAQLKKYLGYDVRRNAVIVGAGKLGRALMDYSGFAGYGISIVAAFDKDKKTIESDERIFDISRMESVCLEKKAEIGIITVPHEFAQEACDMLVKSGIRAVWNFAPAHIIVPDGVLVQHENMAASLAILSNHLS